MESESEPSSQTALSDEDRQWLAAAGIDDTRQASITRVRTVADLPTAFRSWGEKVVPAYCFHWRSVDGHTIEQLRPDNPPLNKDGRPLKYIFPKGSGGLIGIAPGFGDHQQNSAIPALIVEGTKQTLAAASTLPSISPIAVPFGIAGCWNWRKDGKPSPALERMALQGREVIVAFDGDVLTNHSVFAAAKALRESLLKEYLAKEVRFMQIPAGGSGKDGLDDLLGRVPEDRRADVLQKLLDEAEPLPKRGPRKPRRGDSAFFDDGGNLLVQTLWQYLDQEYHLAMAGDESIAVYENGVYWNGHSRRFSRLVADTLADNFRPEHLNSVKLFGLSHLKPEGRVIPFEQDRLLLNFRNGLLDPLTMKIGPHSPNFLTLIQFPFDWDEKATCPAFDAWIEQVLPGQVHVLMDSCSQMLDQSRSPTKMIFLWGPSRSGKSTWLRILGKIAGTGLSSSVSLHSLTTERFAPAQLFGKILNTFADLSGDDLQDVAMLKNLTGGDTVQAEFKGRDHFQLNNMAMLAFSANTVPVVSGEGAAYLGRASVFHFNRSFLGREDPGIEDRLMAELPGIIRLMVVALAERRRRGRFLECDRAVMDDFARRSDQVRRFLAECTRPAPDRPRECLATSYVYKLYQDWTKEQGGPQARPLGKHKFNERVREAGIFDFKTASGVRWALVAHDGGIDPPASPAPGPETAMGQNPGRTGAMTEMAVSPYSSLLRTNPSSSPTQKEWGKTAITAISDSPIIEDDEGLQTTTEAVGAALEALKLAPSALGAVDAVRAHLGDGYGRSAITRAIDALIAEEREDDQLDLEVE